MADGIDGRVANDRDEDDRQQTHQDSVVSIFYNKREAYFSKPHLIARRMNGRVVRLPLSVPKKNKCIWCCQKIIQILDRNTVDMNEKRLGCVHFVTYPSEKCRDTTGRAAFISSTSSPNQRHCLTLVVRRRKAYKCRNAPMATDRAFRHVLWLLQVLVVLDMMMMTQLGVRKGQWWHEIQAVATTMTKTVLSALQRGEGHVVTLPSRSEDQGGVVCHEKQWHCP
jgi:hypothetical protein